MIDEIEKKKFERKFRSQWMIAYCSNAELVCVTSKFKIFRKKK